MGTTVSKPADTAANNAVSDEVELKLLREELSELYRFKILCLGAGESGKSTIVKQLKLIHKAALDDNELTLIGNFLHQNVIDCMKALIHAAQAMNYTTTEQAFIDTADMIETHSEFDRLSLREGERVVELWNAAHIQSAYERRSEFWLLDSFQYYIKHIDRFCAPDFVPNEEDSVMARIRTTGIVTSELEQKIVAEDVDEPESLQFQVVDVGGQRNERKKWIHCFSEVSAILFIVNLAGYKQVLFEDATKNRMTEELELFQQIASNPVFANTPLFLFLNKKDLFESLVTEHPLTAAFPSYTGPMEMLPALTHIQDAFTALLPAGKQVQIASVSARWKRDVRNAFDEVKKTLYDRERSKLLSRAKEIKNKMKKITAAQVSTAGGAPSTGAARIKVVAAECGCDVFPLVSAVLRRSATRPPTVTVTSA